jgi:predicted MPP superfamily phosphohydrolase
MTMRVAWATDLHLNLVSDDDVRKFRREVSRSNPAALLVAGDIAEARNLERYLLLLGGTIGVPIYFVLGNHDFYGGRIGLVREAVRTLTRKDAARFNWLPASRVVKLTEKTCLVGIDGWGDARVGNYRISPVELPDWQQIDDLKFLDRQARLNKLRALGDEASSYLREVLPEALEKFDRVLVLTHVPPFRQACFYQGGISDEDWLPWMCCQATGDALSAMAEKYPEKQITVLCGHTHGGGVAQIRSNLVVQSGAVELGKPAVQSLIEVP